MRHLAAVVESHRAFGHTQRAFTRIVLAVGLVPPVMELLGVEVGQPGQAIHVVGLGLDDPFQAIAGRQVVLLPVRVLQVVVGPEHAVVTAETLGGFASRVRQLGAHQGPGGTGDLVDHLLGQLVLEVEQVPRGAFAFERVAPDRTSVAAVGRVAR